MSVDFLYGSADLAEDAESWVIFSLLSLVVAYLVLLAADFPVGRANSIEDIDLRVANLRQSLMVADFLIPWAFEILEERANFAEDIEWGVATLPSLLTLVAGPAPSAAEKWGCEEWTGGSGVFPLSRLFSLIDFSRLI